MSSFDCKQTYQLSESIPAYLATIAIAVGMVYFSTVEFGIGLSPDSATYLSQAEDLRNARGFRDYAGRFSAHYPPGYQALLATTSLATGRDIRHGAPRLLAASCYATVIVASLCWMQLAGLPNIAIFAGFIALSTHVAILESGVTALSDIVFLALVSMSLCHLELWNRGGNRPHFWIAATFAAIGVLTRYAGVVWPLACGIVLALRSGTEGDRGTKDAIKFVTVCYLPLAFWLAAVAVRSPSGPPRSINLHPIPASTVVHGLETLATAVGFKHHNYSIGLPLFAFLLCHLVSKFISKRRPNALIVTNNKYPIGLCIIITHIPCYLGFLCLSISLFDRATPLDNRVLLTALWGLLLAVIAISHRTLRASMATTRWFFWLLIAWFATRGIWEVVPRLADWNKNGIDLACRDVLYDKSLRYVRESLDKQTEIYSNVSWSVWLACRKPVSQLPVRIAYTSGLENSIFGRELDAVCDSVKTGKAIIVFDTQYSDPFVTTPTLIDLETAGLAKMTNFENTRFVILKSEAKE
jgi:hypothetical protein